MPFAYWEEKNLETLREIAEARNDIHDWLCLLTAQMTVLLKRMNELVEETRRLRESMTGEDGRGQQ